MAQKPEDHTADMVSREEYERLKSRISELEQQVTALTEALRLARHKRFGASSEKTVDDGSQQLSLICTKTIVRTLLISACVRVVCQCLTVGENQLFPLYLPRGTTVQIGSIPTDPVAL